MQITETIQILRETTDSSLSYYITQLLISSHQEKKPEKAAVGVIINKKNCRKVKYNQKRGKRNQANYIINFQEIIGKAKDTPCQEWCF